MSTSGTAFKLTVLCPSGHRVTVKVSRESPVLEVLTEACRKRGLDPAKHRLIFHKKALDNGLSIRYANLPNNANIDLEELEEPVQSSGKPVKLAVQLEGRPRVIFDVADVTTLKDIVRQAQGTDKVGGEGEEPVVVYMRREIVGEEELGKVNLRGLGIVSGTNAAIRVLYKKPEVLKDQAHVPAAAPPHKPVQKEQPWRAMKTDSDITLEKIVGKPQPFQPPPAQEPAPEVDRPVSPEPMDVAAPDPEPSKPSKSAAPEPVVVKPKAPPILKYFGQHNSVIFEFGQGSSTRGLSELSDDFFEMTIDDMKLLYSENKKLLKDLEEGQELLTKGMKEARHEGQKLTLLQKYRRCLIRVQFGHDGKVIQTVFNPSQTVNEVKQALKEFLIDPNMRFYLYTTPPKKVLDCSSNLLDADCVPAALLHFYAEDDEFRNAKCLKSDLPLSNSTGVEQSVQESGVQRRKHSEGGVKRPSELKEAPAEDKKVPKWLSKGKQ